MLVLIIQLVFPPPSPILKLHSYVDVLAHIRVYHALLDFYYTRDASNNSLPRN